MAQGVVKWFNVEKGFGFITPEGGGPDVFVHYSAIDAQGYRQLAEGERVEFEAPTGSKQNIALSPVGTKRSEVLVAEVLRTGEARPGAKSTPAPSPRRVTLPLADLRTTFLMDMFGGAAALARIFGVSRSQPSRWSAGSETPSPRTAQQLLNLDHVAAKVSMIWPRPVALQWLESPNAALGGARPVDLVVQGRTSEVVEELEALEQGALG